MPTRPGFHNSTSFSEYPSGFAEAIRSIGQSFYVTRSFNQEKVGNSEYWGLLARPSDDFSVHLNADRELLFVFSSYENFEIRTLEAFELFYAQLEQKRVDKSIRFLVSGDPRIEEIIQHYLNQHPEFPIIIPIYIRKIKESGNHILDAIRRNYLVRDLFGYQNPLREETFFFGRYEQVNAILDLAKSGQSSSIFGLRKSGKTSSIYAIMRRARSFECTPVFIDCQNPVVHTRRYKALLSYIISEAKRSIGHRRASITLEGDDAQVAELFREQLKTVLSQSKTTLLFIFDEIENISPGTAASPHWDTERDSLLFWQNIRSFIQQDSQGRMAICMVGTSPFLLEKTQILGVANPMYLFSQKRFLPAFTFDDTRQMIERLGFFMGLEFEPTQIGKLQSIYGGHPFFIRQVCSNVHQICGENRPVKVLDRVIDEAIERFGGQLDTYLSEILNGLQRFYPDEFELLRAVVLGDRSEITDFGRQTPELIDHLIGYGLVENKGAEFDIRFDSVKRALKRIFQKPSIDQRWTECMLRRNAIEKEIRRELFSFAKAFNNSEWSQFLKSSLTTKRFDNLSSVEPRLLFSQRKSPLYWSDLMSILQQETVFPHLNGRRRAIIEAMSAVNRNGRSDAHANDLSESEFSIVMSALDVLEEEFAAPY